MYIRLILAGASYLLILCRAIERCKKGQKFSKYLNESFGIPFFLVRISRKYYEWAKKNIIILTTRTATTKIRRERKQHIQSQNKSHIFFIFLFTLAWQSIEYIDSMSFKFIEWWKLEICSRCSVKHRNMFVACCAFESVQYVQ